MHKVSWIVLVVVAVSGVAHGGEDENAFAGIRLAGLEQQQTPVLYAQAGGDYGTTRCAGRSAQRWESTINEGGFGSDVTALFRYRRWRHPFAPGGVICWLNPGAWSKAPYRTLTVLVGEAIIALSVDAIVDASEGDDDGDTAPVADEPAPSDPAPTSSGGGSDDDSSDDDTSGGGSSGGDAPTGGGGDEKPL